MTAPALQLWHVRKKYGKREALRDVSIRVEPGECYGLAGPNGAGKTTLIRLLLGLSIPDSGEVRLFGQRPEDPAVREQVGFVPESAELPPAASPGALMRRFARLRGLPDTAAEEGVEQLERLGMRELLDRPANRLSKGEKQRTLLALALLGAPQLLVLDEPTDGLDPLGRALVRRVLREEREKGRTVFLNSHLLTETERICSRVGILHRGQLVREHAATSPAGGQSAVVLSAPPAAPVANVRAAPSLQGQATEAEGATVLVDHHDLAELNLALDRLRASGAEIVEVRRVREDLEASFEAALTGAPQPIDPGPAPSAPVARRSNPFRTLKATVRVAKEIAADLSARKVQWIALAVAVALLLVFVWVVRNDVTRGAAAAARQFTAGGLTDAQTVRRWIGRWSATALYWGLLPASLLFASLFAPPLLEPRRSILLHAQPVSRGEVAAALFGSVCAIALCEHLFLAALLFGALRWIDVAVSPLLLLAVLPLLIAFATLYAASLAAAYLSNSGLVSAAVALGVFVAAVVENQKVAAAFLPRVVPLAEQAARFGEGDLPRASPFLLTFCFGAAFFLVTVVLARRSER